MLSPLRPTDLTRGKTSVSQLSCRNTLSRLPVARKCDDNTAEDAGQQVARSRFHAPIERRLDSYLLSADCLSANPIWS